MSITHFFIGGMEYEKKTLPLLHLMTYEDSYHFTACCFVRLFKQHGNSGPAPPSRINCILFHTFFNDLAFFYSFFATKFQGNGGLLLEIDW